MTVHGIGLITYGERDYWPDGSFITTEWVVFAYVPIFPSLSRRIHHTNVHNPYAMPHRDGYYVYDTMNPNLRQVLYVYVWMASLVAVISCFELAAGRLVRIVGNEDRAAVIALGALAVVLVMPWILRRWTKRRLRQQWLREAAGLGPTGL